MRPDVARWLARASNVHSCNIRKCFMMRKEDADNEAKPLPPANINHTDRGEELTLFINTEYFYHVNDSPGPSSFVLLYYFILFDILGA